MGKHIMSSREQLFQIAVLEDFIKNQNEDLIKLRWKNFPKELFNAK